MSINEILKQMKDEYEFAISSNGSEAQTSLICSQRLINILHNKVKSEFLNLGVNSSLVLPPLGETKPEIKIAGLLKAKSQDVCIIPKDISLNDIKNNHSGIERILTVNVRSQLSSMAKNIDTLYERTFAEPLNLHLKYPKQCLGEVYLIPTHEYCSESMKNSCIKFKQFFKLEDYINKFQIINGRINHDRDEYKYERVCLLIVDFRENTPKLYSDIDELKNDGLIPQNANVSMEGLTFDNFAQDLLNIYEQRFGLDINLLKV